MNLPGRDFGWKDFFVSLKNEYKKDKVNDAAGALTYFGVLAIFPFLLFLIALASVLIRPEQAQALVDQLAQVAPPAVTQILGDRLKQLAQQNNTGLLSVGAVGALWAASGGVVAMMRALNTAYDVEEQRPFWKVRGVAFLFVLGGGALGLLATLAAVATPALAAAVGGPLGTVLLWLRVPVAAALVMFVWACAYYFLPDVEQRFRFITPGSIVGVLIWLAASLGFSVYVSNFGKYDATYGSLGGVIVLLLWMWISSQVLLLGAEINSLIEHRSPEGKEPGDKRLDEGAAAPGHAAHAPSADRRPRLERQELATQSRAVAHQPVPEPHSRRRGPARTLGGAFWGALLGAALIQRVRRHA